MKQKLSLQQKLLQKLSPQQIQVIKLLEIPALQLEQRIKKELEENPVLEVEDDSAYGEEESENPELRTDEDKDNEEFSVEDYMPEDEIPGYKLQTNNYSPDDKQMEIPFSVGDTFHEFLQEQAGMDSLNDHQQMLAEYIIGNIDEDGYLRRDLPSISDDLAFHLNMNVSEEELAKILEVIQGFDPPGVGARTLQECLLLQLNRRPGEHQKLAITIIRDYFEEFTKKHYDKISRRLNVDDTELKQAIDLILKLNPKPGSSYSNPLNKSNQHIVPDFILESVDGELQLSLNQKNLPELRINESYLDMLRTMAGNRNNSNKNTREAATFVKQKLDSARWFIDAIRQRQQTLLATMAEIIDLQKEYFRDGDETRLKPMILKDISERTGLDISTISRVSNSKYIQTHFGIFPLKYFFSEAMQTDTGEEVSTREIKKILKECIDNEDKRHPVTDEKLTEILREKSYNIARRTVAKYREQLEIPVARMRKEL
jgi:RNA polymerase sigma-54 factor